MMVLTVSRKDLKTAFRNKANFDEFVNDVIDKMKGVELSMQIICANPIKDRVVIKVRCPFCGKESIVTMKYNQWRRYVDGKEYVQQIFPEKSATERELLTSGMCSKCWDQMFTDKIQW